MSARIASLLPAATEWLAELGLGESVVAISHECDHPPAVVAGKPRVTSSRVDPTASAAAIDERVRALHAAGEDLYAIDAPALERLAPDVIVTQAQCDVCAVSEGSVRALAARLPSPPTVVALAGSSIESVLQDVLAIGRACGVADRALTVVEGFRRALDDLRAARPARRKRAVHLEWVDPPMTAGSWIPELALAAGLDLFRADLAGQKSVKVSWESIVEFAPELVTVAPCGFDEARAKQEARRVQSLLDARGAAPTGPPRSPPRGSAPRAPRRARIIAADGNAFFNRPGPRLLDAARFLARVAR